MLVSYIDRNPVSAGLAGDAASYAYGSARHYSRPSGPPWLERSWIESEVRDRLGLDSFRPERYSEVFRKDLDPSIVRWVDQRSRSRQTDDPLDDLVASAPGRVLKWMKRKAELADGTQPGLAPIPLEVLDRVIAEKSAEWWVIRKDGISRDAWAMARVGLARDLCAAGLAELSARERMATCSASRLHGLHRRLLLEDAEYGARIEDLARMAIGFWERW